MMAGPLMQMKKLRPTSVLVQQVAGVHNRSRIGNRDVVGYGLNGEYTYVDHIAFPMPAVRFRENTPEVMALREKEKLDWKKMSVEEKKTLYRASFCQTYSEMRAPSGEWKSIMGCTLGLMALSYWMYMWAKVFVYPPMPDTILNEEKRSAQLKRMIDIRVDPVDGLTSNWDYENNRWKK